MRSESGVANHAPKSRIANPHAASERSFGVDFLFFPCKKIHQKRGQTGVFELPCDVPVSRTQTTAPAAMCEQYDSSRRVRDREVALQDSPTDWNLHGFPGDWIFALVHHGLSLNKQTSQIHRHASLPLPAELRPASRAAQPHENAEPSPNDPRQ